MGQKNSCLSHCINTCMMNKKEGVKSEDKVQSNEYILILNEQATNVSYFI
jgi:hypothetical protein